MPNWIKYRPVQRCQKEEIIIGQENMPGQNKNGRWILCLLLSWMLVQWCTLPTTFSSRHSPFPPVSHLCRIRSSSGEALAKWPNKCRSNWFKWVMSPEKEQAWNRPCWCKLHSIFKFSTFFSKMPQSSNWEIFISNNKIFLIFVIFIVSYLVVIYFRDNTSIFSRLLHLI